MTEKPEVRHTFQGPHRYRVFLMVTTLTMAVILAIAGLVFNADANWARQLCPLVGALSAVSFACLVAVDIYRPQNLTAARKKVAVRFLLILPVIAIALAGIGFFA